MAERRFCKPLIGVRFSGKAQALITICTGINRGSWVRIPEAAQKAVVAEWAIAPDCKSGAVRLRRFESYPRHQALVAQLVERALGKGKVSGSIPDKGS